MEKEKEIVNKVSESGIVTIDLEDFYPQNEIIVIDLKPILWMEMALKEKDFRDFLKIHDWAQYTDKNVCIICSSDAIIPTWAYMLLATKLKPYAQKVVFGNEEQLLVQLYETIINEIDVEKYRDRKVVIKGCGKNPIPTNAYIRITERLLAVSSSIMFGEPCSTVPVYKRAK